ncbi:pseudouridine-5'-phosphate glycosidase [Alteribacillus persepolensis]|uniref:Pseudouridine-5'-phosphate glycosidase n=1 Tax=Alteribacillus persepolensis TaxID=568899 RepID=A0A1G8EG12_9BACI|nr:pseudouridine-5'-phosphate glycosidase [Alteribacillus persepolensis]SDH68872.1 pseudouridine-5'-phosphate glycosidase [Alteribacillus persepolensis]
MNVKDDMLVLSEEVRDAVQKNKPVVALESTIISHGMPYPQNVETALEVEELIRNNGAVPATIAVIHGKIKIGLTEEEIAFLGQSDAVEKVSRRDLPYVISTKKHGATTVAGTMICASMAGIKVFATGGIGGVHRGAEKTMDISADLEELAKTDVAVVCAGVKSILDLGLTLEYLETNGVPVIGHNTDALPAFYTRTSPFQVDYRLNSPEEIANFIDTKQDIGLSGGVVVANPIPEKDALDEAYISSIIDHAVKEAEDKNIAGKEATPFILDKVKTLTEGKSLKANIGLVKHNAVVGAQIAAHCKHGDE